MRQQANIPTSIGRFGTSMLALQVVASMFQGLGCLPIKTVSELAQNAMRQQTDLP